MSEEFGKDLGLVHEAVVTGRKVGADKDFWAALAHSESLFEKVVAFVATMLSPVFRLVAGLGYDKAKDGWKIFSDAESKEGEFVPELVEFLKDGESYVRGDVMVERTEHQDNGGQRVAEAMLRDQGKIPEELRRYILVFPKTRWSAPDGYERVACLHWSGDRWSLHFFFLDDDFYGRYRVVRLRK